MQKTVIGSALLIFTCCFSEPIAAYSAVCVIYTDALPDNRTRVGRLRDKALALYKKGSFKSAERILHRAARIEPRNNDIKFVLASCLYMRKKYKQAIPLYLSVSQEMDDADFLAAACYERSGQYSAAIKYYKSFLSRIRFPPENSQGSSYLVSGYRLTALNRLRKLDPSFNEADFPIKYKDASLFPRKDILGRKPHEPSTFVQRNLSKWLHQPALEDPFIFFDDLSKK